MLSTSATRSFWNHMMKSCETSRKQVAQTCHRLPSFLTHHSPLILPLLSSSRRLLGRSPTHLFFFPPTHSIIYGKSCSRSRGDLGVSHWLPHQIFALGPVHSLHGIACPFPQPNYSYYTSDMSTADVTHKKIVPGSGQR